MFSFAYLAQRRFFGRGTIIDHIVVVLRDSLLDSFLNSCGNVLLHRRDRSLDVAQATGDFFLCLASQTTFVRF